MGVHLYGILFPPKFKFFILHPSFSFCVNFSYPKFMFRIPNSQFYIFKLAISFHVSSSTYNSVSHSKFKFRILSTSFAFKLRILYSSFAFYIQVPHSKLVPHSKFVFCILHSKFTISFTKLKIHILHFSTSIPHFYTSRMLLTHHKA